MRGFEKVSGSRGKMHAHETESALSMNSKSVVPIAISLFAIFLFASISLASTGYYASATGNYALSSAAIGSTSSGSAIHPITTANAPSSVIVKDRNTTAGYQIVSSVISDVSGSVVVSAIKCNAALSGQQVASFITGLGVASIGFTARCAEDSTVARYADS